MTRQHSHESLVSAPDRTGKKRPADHRGQDSVKTAEARLKHQQPGVRSFVTSGSPSGENTGEQVDIWQRFSYSGIFSHFKQFTSPIRSQDHLGVSKEYKNQSSSSKVLQESKSTLKPNSPWYLHFCNIKDPHQICDIKT